MGEVYAPHALPMYREEQNSKKRKERSDRKDPVRSKKPDPPVRSAPQIRSYFCRSCSKSIFPSLIFAAAREHLARKIVF